MILKLSTQPNPFSNSIRLDIASEQQAPVIIRITDQAGQMVKIYSWKLVQGMNTLILTNLQNLEIGNYNLDLTDDDGQMIRETEITKL